MREIKFRAWNKNKQVMEDIILINLRNKQILIDTGEEVNLLEFHEVELMQYTGLRDKNGREIYEGDIVRFKDWWDEEMVGEVRYSEKDMAFTIVNDFWDGFPIMYADDLEVIGNIYKNPELLEAAEE